MISLFNPTFDFETVDVVCQKWLSGVLQTVINIRNIQELVENEQETIGLEQASRCLYQLACVTKVGFGYYSF